MVIAILIIRMNVLFPDIAGLIHIFAGEIKVLHGLGRPLGMIIFHVTDIDISAFGYDLKRAK